MKFQILKSLNGLYYYVLVGRNGEIMLTSEMMMQKQSCKKSIASIKRSVGLFTRVEDRTPKIKKL